MNFNKSILLLFHTEPTLLLELGVNIKQLQLIFPFSSVILLSEASPLTTKLAF